MTCKAAFSNVVFKKPSLMQNKQMEKVEIACNLESGFD